MLVQGRRTVVRCILSNKNSATWLCLYVEEQRICFERVRATATQTQGPSQRVAQSTKEATSRGERNASGGGCANADHAQVRRTERGEELVLIFGKLLHKPQRFRVVQQLHVRRQLEVGPVWRTSILRQVLFAAILEPHQVLEVAAVRTDSQNRRDTGNSRQSSKEQEQGTGIKRERKRINVSKRGRSKFKQGCTNFITEQPPVASAEHGDEV
jgi:hypothetical protein